MCGEHPGVVNVSCAQFGSSPRVRGTHDTLSIRQAELRFIPACAGNTHDLAIGDVGGSVHPRVCGEHAPMVTEAQGVFGSSPRVRGTRTLTNAIRSRHRFIPACAGNTLRFLCRSGLSSVHPRVCGEHEAAHIAVESGAGSSPRVRGTHATPPRPRPCVRFIPACAGNTYPSSATPRRNPVHPRVCGEHVSHDAITANASGSSPRVRGTQPRRRGGLRRRRFIPACAGNTAQVLPTCLLQTVHPRVCGEHVLSPFEVVDHGGSSPRVRGTL